MRSATTDAARVGAAWLRATQALGYALTTREMAAQWTRFGEGSPPRPISTTVQTLIRQGVIVRVTGRQGHCRYAHVAHSNVAVEPCAAEHFGARVLAALGYASTAAQRFVTTREVTQAMYEVGQVEALTKDEQTLLWQQLRAATESRRQRVAPFGQELGPVTMAVTHRVSAQHASRERVYWWRPTDLPFPEPDADRPATGREAATRVAEAVRAVLGRPATSDEIALYVAWRRVTTPKDALVLVLDEQGLGNALLRARGWIDRTTAAGRSGEHERGLLSLTTAYTAGRLMPPRIGLPSFTALDVARASASDLLLRLQPAREIELMDALSSQLDGPSAPMRDLMQLRRTLLRRALLLAVDEAEWPAMLSHLQHVLHTTEQWVAVLKSWGNGSGRASRTLRALGPRAMDLQAVASILAWRDEDIPDRFRDLEPITMIGDAAVMTFAELAPLHASLDALGLGRPNQVHPIFRHARRLPAARTECTVERTSTTAKEQERLDRVDAFAAAISYVGTPVTGTLVGDAVMLLGATLRDARVVECVLDGERRRDAWVRRGLLVALGMLGVAPASAQWADVAEDAAAGVLGTVLADPTNATAVLRQLLTSMGSPGRRIATDAITLAEIDEWLALLG